MSTRVGEWRVLPDWHYRAILLVLACTLAAMLAILFILLRLANPAPGLRMTNVVVEAPSALCPGEWLAWHHTLTLDGDVSLPARLFVTRTLYNEQGLQVYDDANPLFPVIDTRSTLRQRAFQIPPTDAYGHAWHAGSYTLDYGASLPGRNITVSIRIPFQIRSDCERK